MKIIFISSPPVSKKMFCMVEDCCVSARGVPVLPSLLINVASAAKSNGHEVTFVDASIEKVRKEVVEKHDLVISTIMLKGHDVTARYISRIACGKKVVMICHPPGYALDFMKKFEFDAIIFAEPERAMLSLPDSVACLYEWANSTKGVLCKNKTVYDYPKCSFSSCSNTDYSIVPRRYFSKYATVNYQVSRGCPYRCTFCLWGGSTVTDLAYSVKSPSVVSDDMDRLEMLAGRKIPLYLLTSQLTTSLNWIKGFCEARGQNVYKYRSNFNIAELTKEKAILLKRSGLDHFAAGMEAIDDSCLAMLKKPHSFDDIIKCVAMLGEVGYRYRFHIRYGYGETEADVARSIVNLKEFNKIARSSSFDIGPIVHYKGTVIYRDAKYEVETYKGSDDERLIDSRPPLDMWKRFVVLLSEKHKVRFKRAAKQIELTKKRKHR